MCSIIYKLLDDLSMRLVDAAPVIEEEVVAGSLQVLALFSATVKKSVNAAGKQAVAGCKVRTTVSCDVCGVVHGALLCARADLQAFG